MGKAEKKNNTSSPSDPFEACAHFSRLIGADSNLVLHGGGNTSLKETKKDIFNKMTNVMHVKGSGWDMSNLTEEGMPTVCLLYTSPSPRD